MQPPLPHALPRAPSTSPLADPKRGHLSWSTPSSAPATLRTRDPDPELGVGAACVHQGGPEDRLQVPGTMELPAELRVTGHGQDHGVKGPGSWGVHVMEGPREADAEGAVVSTSTPRSRQPRGPPWKESPGAGAQAPSAASRPNTPRAPWLRKARSAAQAGPSSSPPSCACCLARKFYEETKATAPLFSKTRQARRGDGGVAAPARRATCGLCPWRPRPRAHGAASHAGISDALSRELISLLQAKYENDNLR